MTLNIFKSNCLTPLYFKGLSENKHFIPASFNKH